MGLVTCEPCGKTMESGRNLSQHLIGKAHLKKVALWMADRLPVRSAAPTPVTVVQFMDLDDDEDDFHPTVAVAPKALQQPLPTQPVLKFRAPTVTIPTIYQSTLESWAPTRNVQPTPIPQAKAPIPTPTTSPY